VHQAPGVVLVSVGSDVHHPIYSLQAFDDHAPNDFRPIREVDEITPFSILGHAIEWDVVILPAEYFLELLWRFLPSDRANEAGHLVLSSPVIHSVGAEVGLLITYRNPSL
jgi:hypothetical protein